MIHSLINFGTFSQIVPIFFDNMIKVIVFIVWVLYFWGVTKIKIMKIKTTIEFYLDSEVYGLNDCKSDSEMKSKQLDVYNREYAKHGYQFDKTRELLSKTFKCQILLNIDDIINICSIEYRVIEKEFYLDNNELYYLLSSDLN